MRTNSLPPPLPPSLLLSSTSLFLSYKEKGARLFIDCGNNFISLLVVVLKSQVEDRGDEGMGFHAPIAEHLVVRMNVCYVSFSCLLDDKWRFQDLIV